MNNFIKLIDGQTPISDLFQILKTRYDTYIPDDFSLALAIDTVLVILDLGYKNCIVFRNTLSFKHDMPTLERHKIINMMNQNCQAPRFSLDEEKISVEFTLHFEEVLRVDLLEKAIGVFSIELQTAFLEYEEEINRVRIEDSRIIGSLGLALSNRITGLF